MAPLLGPRTCDWTGPKSKVLRRERITITLLNEHIIKQIPNNLPLYPQISASLKPHLGIFFLQGMVINTETHNQSRCRDYEAVEWSARNGTSRLLLPRLGIIMAEGQKDCEKPEAVYNYKEAVFPDTARQSPS